MRRRCSQLLPSPVELRQPQKRCPFLGRAEQAQSVLLLSYACSALHRGTLEPRGSRLLWDSIPFPFTPAFRPSPPEQPQGPRQGWGSPRGKLAAADADTVWSASSRGDQLSGLEGWGRHHPAWKLSSLQGDRRRGGGLSSVLHGHGPLSRTRTQQRPDQLNLAALNSPQAHVTYKSIHA